MDEKELWVDEPTGMIGMPKRLQASLWFSSCGTCRDVHRWLVDNGLIPSPPEGSDQDG
jgi:hypothetical protein